MIPKGNPAHIKTLRDLGKPGVRLSMPNPKWEGVARQIQISLRKAGGPALERMVYDTKVKNGETILTHIHHRQTPLFLMQGLADAGVTWKSEAIFQEQAGHPISNIPICSESSSVADGCVSHLRQTLSLCFERACRDSFANSSRIRFANSCSAAARY
ncbi:substrate-binding domain-containing protein [Acidithiobacillus sulfuriphilus]|uniref:substrate-binding domain-containing protein n=1 Tax=Acidithiobacillus sulfuriphilus TaxID=1867749 RepID=UPI003F608AB7